MVAGSNKMLRGRGVCLALVLAAAVAEPNLLTDEILRAYTNLPAWVAQAKQMHTRLFALQSAIQDQDVTDHRAGGGRNPRRSKTRSRSRGRASASGGAGNKEPQPRNLTKQELVAENEDLRAQVHKLHRKLDRVVAIAKY